MLRPEPGETVSATPPAAHAWGSWYRALTQRERRALKACFWGWALDAMDVQLYSFVVPALIATWGITRADAGLLGSAALVSSALGGWGAGWLADRWGRVRTLQLTIAWFAGFTFLSGLAQDFNQLFVARVLMGFGFGGEWAAGAVLLGETIRPEHRGKAVGFMQSGWAIGWGAAALLYTVLFSIAAPEVAWRALFIVGVGPAILVFLLRRLVSEPDVYLASRARAAQGGGQSSSFRIFAPPLLRTTILGALVSTGAQGGYYAIAIWLPTYLSKERGLSILNTGGYLAVLIGSAFVGYIVGAYLSDTVGRRATFIVFAIGSFIIVLVYTLVPVGEFGTLVLGAPLGFFSTGVFSAMGAFFTEQFPTEVRGAGQGFAYNFGRAVGALFPWLVGILSATIPLGTAIGTFAAAAYVLMAVSAYMLPETRGKVLTP